MPDASSAAVRGRSVEYLPHVLLEREEAVQAGLEVIEEARAGCGRALFISGPPGTGKTAVLDILSSCGSSAVRVLRARGEYLEMALPFGVAAQLLDNLGARAEFGNLARCTETGLQLDIFYSVLDRLRDCEPLALLVLVDDLQWADTESLLLLGFICRRIANLNVAVIGSMRAWPARAREVAAGLVHDGLATHVFLESLSARAGAMLLERRCGNVGAEMAQRAWILCGGNPLLLEHFGAAILDGESIPDPMDAVCRRLSRDLLLVRFAGLPELGLRAAQAASVFDSGFSADLVSELLQMDDPAAIDDVFAGLELNHLVSTRRGRDMRFVHPVFQQALYTDLPSPLRTRLHSRAFAALHRLGRDKDAASHAVRAQLYGDEDAINVLEVTGTSALRTGSLGVAVSNLSAATELSVERSSATTLLYLGQALVGAGRAAEAVPILDHLLVDSQFGRSDRAELLRTLCRAKIMTGAATECATWCADTDTALEMALNTWTVQGARAALGQLSRCTGVSDERVDSVRGFLILLTGDPSQLASIETLAKRLITSTCESVPDLLWSWDVVRSYGVAATCLERFDEAGWALGTALQAAWRKDAAYAVALLSSVLGDVLVRLGRLEEARQVLDRAATLVSARSTAATLWRPVEASLRLHTGSVHESDDWSRRAFDAAAEPGSRVALLRSAAAQAQRLVGEGRLRDACALSTRMESLARDLAIEEPCLVPWARPAVTAYALSNRYADAMRLLGWLDRSSQRLPCRWPRIVLAVGKALLAERRHDVDEAESHFQVALELHGQVTLPLEHVQTLLDYGSFLRRAGKPKAARRALDDALEQANAAGSGWLSALIQEEHAASGGRRQRLRHAVERLTPQESRVASLAGRGSTNREIAERLSVSESTIESHLQRVYGKLQIHSRRQLMAQAAGLNGSSH